jgi:PKD repeat protein
MLSRSWVLLCMLSFQFEWSPAQCVPPDFSIPSGVCLNENLKIFSNTPYQNYEWDFCAGDLDQTPNATVFQASAGSAFNVEVVSQSGEYYGFYTSRSNASLYRLDFGTGVNGAPTPLNLGSLGLSSPGWLTIKIVNEGGNYYGFIIDFYNKIYRINFGSSITNQPTDAEILYQDGSLSNPIDLAVLDDASGKYAFVASYSSNTLTKIVFSNSFGESVNLISASSLTIFGSGNSSGLSFVRECNLWYAVVPSLSGQIFKLTFNGLNDLSPALTQISGLSFTPSTLGGVSIAFDNSKYYAFVQSQGASDLYRIDFGNSMANSVQASANLGNFGTLSGIWGFSMYRAKSNWLVLSSENNGNKIYKIAFPNNCFSNNEFSTQSENEVVASTTGSYNVSLTVTDNSGNKLSASKQIVVALNYAPDITLSSQNICANNNVNFVAANNSGNITSLQWDFNDGGTSTSVNPSHTYATASTYNPSVTVMASNGCQNTAKKTIQIFNPPIANFSLPPANPFCTGQNYLFTNTSVFDNGSNPAWQWSINGSAVATTKDLNQLFASSSAQSITLTASIPGCSSQATHNISSLTPGPLVSFSSPSTGCQGSPIPFDNKTTDPVTSFSWTFGDGNSSSAFNSSNTYTSTGQYQVTLSATNAAGCQNSSSKPINIYSNPDPKFLIEAPPLSCEKWPAQFDNLTPPLVDSNIISWQWSFADASNGSSVLKNPSYTYASAGSYDVTLQAKSNFGCTNSVQKTVTILSSPAASFTNTPACVNLSTQFTGGTGGNIAKYQWSIDGNTITNPDPTYTFKSSGSYPVTLTVTSTNGCVNQYSQTISVPVVPTLDFSVQAPCTGHPTTFQEINSGAPDPTASWNWSFGQGSGVNSPVSFLFSSAGTYPVTMTTKRESGCVYSFSKNVTIYDGPVASFTPSVLAGAAPLAVTFVNNSLVESSSWDFGDQSAPADATSPSHTYTSLGAYKAVLTAKSHSTCSDTVSTVINVVIPHIDIVMNSFSLTSDPNSNTAKPLVTILNSGNIPLVNPEVVIDLGGGVLLKEKISGLLKPGKSIVQTLDLQIIPQAILYVCAEIDVADDVDLANNKQCVSLSSEDVVMNPYPNPSTSGRITLQWISANQENVRITIYKSNGSIAFAQDLDERQSGLGQLTIDTSLFANGLYLIQFVGDKITKTFRIVIAN